MVRKVYIRCDEVIEPEDQVDYDVFASYFKRDRDGMIFDQVAKPVVVYFHLKCFKQYKKDEKKKDLIFTEVVGGKRLIIKEI